MDNKYRPYGVDDLILEYIGDDPERIASFQYTYLNIEIAGMIYDLRKEQGLTQKELADMIGTKHSVISRLEDADYEGYTLKMLHRIATAFGKTIEIKFVDPEIKGPLPSARLKAGQKKNAGKKVSEKAPKQKKKRKIA